MDGRRNCSAWFGPRPRRRRVPDFSVPSGTLRQAQRASLRSVPDGTDKRKRLPPAATRRGPNDPAQQRGRAESPELTRTQHRGRRLLQRLVRPLQAPPVAR
jgi:hypothetical protein